LTFRDVNGLCDTWVFQQPAGVIYFFSDVHLGLGTRDDSRRREDAVVRFLDKARNDGIERLFIVGDLFDYWFDYRTVIPRDFVRTLGAIAALVDSGIPVDYVIGNHDFGHRDFFASELGVTVHSGDLDVTLAGRRCCISHGDGKAFNDTAYAILKKVLRSPVSGFIFRLLHPDVGIGVAAYASRRSRSHTTSKHYGGERPGEADGLSAFAEKKIREEGFELVVMGHSHRLRRVDLEGGTYVNLGSWLGPEKRFLALDSTSIEVRTFDT